MSTEADLAGHLNNRDGQEIGSQNRHEATVNDDILKDNQVLDAVNLLKGMHILGQPGTGDKPTNPPIAPNIDVKPQYEGKPH